MERISNKILARRRFLKLGMSAVIASIPRPDQANALTPPEPTSTPEPDIEVEKPWTSIALITSYCIQGKTRSGTYTREGVIATDPDVIPLGSLVDIETLGENYIAEDTGSAVRGWHIDVWSSDCTWSVNWGRQDRRIRVTRRGW